MRPTRAIPNSDARSGQSDGRCAQTAQRNYGSARPHCESCPRPVALGRVWARATESRRAEPVPGLGHCHKRHRPGYAGNSAGPHTGARTWLPAGGPRGHAARPLFDSHRWHLLLSLQPPRAWRGRHRLGAAPSRICRDPRGWGPSVRPFFCRLLGAVQQHLIPIDSLQGFIALRQLSPRRPKGLQFQPEREPPLHGFVGRKARGQHAPPNPRDKNIEYGMKTLPVTIGRTSIASSFTK
jgi:hypothetical protein